MEAGTPFHWSTSSELALFQILARNKPAGMNKHFSMAVAVEALANTLDEDRQVTGEDIWAKLRTMYDLAAVDDREEVIPFPLEEREFSLPRRDFSSLINEKQKEILRDRKEVAKREGKSGIVRMGQDMGPEGAMRRAQQENTKVVRAGDKEGKEKDQQNQQASIWASSSSSSVLQLALQQMAKTKELEETMEESKSKAGGLKRHATRSTPSSSGSNTPAKRRTNK